MRTGATRDEKAHGQAIMTCDNLECKIATFIQSEPYDACPLCHNPGRTIVAGPVLGINRIGQASRPR